MRREGAEIALSPREFALLQLLMERPGTILSRAQIEERLYGWGEEVESNAVEVHIHGLRTQARRRIHPQRARRGLPRAARPMSSLRARLLAWLLGGVVAVGAPAAASSTATRSPRPDEFFDYHLRQTALILRDEPVEYLLLPQIPATDAAYDFVVQVWSLDGVRVYLSRPHAVLPQITTLGFATVEHQRGPLARIRRAGRAARDPGGAADERAPASAPRSSHCRRCKPFALLLPVLALLIWLAVGWALQPLQRLTALVKARRVDALDALPDARLPDEVQPLVTALNDLLERLRQALERERAFMADAAHELRTPLTALHLQMGMLARASGESERLAAMETLSAGRAARHPSHRADAGARPPGAAQRAQRRSGPPG